MGCVPWTIKEVNFLRRLVNSQKLSSGKIYRNCYFVGRSLASINSQMSCLGLSSLATKGRMKNSWRLSKEEKEKLSVFLNGEGRHMPNSDVAKILETSVRNVRRYRRRWKLKLNPKESFSSKIFKRTHKRSIVALKNGYADYRERRPMRRRAELVELFRQLAESRCKIPHRKCKDCGEWWFDSEIFFYHARIMANNKLRLSNHCKACGFPWINKKRAKAKKVAA
ncbi:MAG: hypothetical protein ABR875_00380 [Minisyncoccia bacterium]|jgi:DNA-binding CsgD family transcriptional regulator